MLATVACVPEGRPIVARQFIAWDATQTIKKQVQMRVRWQSTACGSHRTLRDEVRLCNSWAINCLAKVSPFLGNGFAQSQRPNASGYSTDPLLPDSDPDISSRPMNALPLNGATREAVNGGLNPKRG